MSFDYRQKQGAKEPLFPDLLWSKPENKKTAGKLLIIGGQASSFAHVAKAYEQATGSGAGSIKTLLPDSLAKVAGFLPDVEFASANKSGGFAASALDTFLDLSAWTDMVLLAGDLGKSSETIVLLDKFIEKYEGPLTVSSASFESIDISLTSRDKTLLVTDLHGLQQVTKRCKFDQAITSSMGIVNFAKALSDFSKSQKSYLVCKFDGYLWAAVDGKISSTEVKKEADINTLSAASSVWLMQNPSKPFEALTTACYV